MFFLFVFVFYFIILLVVFFWGVFSLFLKVLGIMQGTSGLNDSELAGRLGFSKQRYYILKSCKDIKLGVLLNCCRACGFTIVLTNGHGVNVDLVQLDDSLKEEHS